MLSTPPPMVMLNSPLSHGAVQFTWVQEVHTQVFILKNQVFSLNWTISSAPPFMFYALCIIKKYKES